MEQSGEDSEDRVKLCVTGEISRLAREVRCFLQRRCFFGIYERYLRKMY